MNTQTDNAIAILSTALAPRQMKRNGEIVQVACAWIPPMSRRYTNLILGALLAQQEQIQVLRARVEMLEQREKEQVSE